MPPQSSVLKTSPQVSIADSGAIGSRPVVSILIVNFNGAKWLRGCLDSLRTVEFPSYEVIVVDNVSRDDSLAMLRSYPEVKVIRSEENLGFAGGNNLGLPHCSGKYVLLLNNDTVVNPDFLQPLSDYLDRFPQVAVVQGKMILPRFSRSLDVCGSFLTSFGLPYHYGFYKPDGPTYCRDYPVFSAKGACLMFRKEIVNKTGGFLFDSDFFCYYEETDFCHRVWLSGYEVHFVNTPPIEHYMGATSGDSQSAFVLRHYLRNMTFSLASNLSPGARWRILPPFLLILFASMVASIIRGKAGQARAHWEALICPWRDASGIRKRRRLIASIRVRSDIDLLSRVIRNPSLDYFLKTFTGNLREYEDKLRL
jgi:GT2 family glycosyltransferase